MADDPGAGLSRAGERAVLAAAILGTVMGVLEISVVNIALPVIQRELGASWTAAQWVMEAYILMLAALILPGGAIADRHGRRRWFGLGIAVFTVASAACGLAQSGGQLVVARLLQGAGAAFMIPGSLALIAAAFPARRRGRAIGMWSAATAIAVAGAPAFAGWVVEASTWRLLFLINLPLGALTLAVVFTAVPESRAQYGRRLDWPGAVLVTVALACLTGGLLEAGRPHADQGAVAGLLAAAVLALAAFLLSQVTRRDTLVPTRLFRDREFTGINLATLLLYAGLQAATFFLPFLLMQVRGYSPLAAGASLLPFVVIIAVLSPISGRLTDRIGPRPLLVVGMLIATGAFVLLSRLAGPETGNADVLIATGVLGCGMGLIVAPVSTVALNAAGAADAGVASAINNTMARVGGLLAIALFGLWAAAVFHLELAGGLAELDLAPAQIEAILAQRDRLAALEPPVSLAADSAAAVRELVGDAFGRAYHQIMLACAALAAGTAVVAARTVRAAAAADREGRARSTAG